MSLRSITVVAALSLAAVAWPAMAQEPSLHDVYQAAESGNFSQAQRMMDQVLSAHPNSAKAHYVEAELLAKQGRLPAAGAELATAERLDAGLSFAKPEAVRALKAQIASRTAGGNGFSTATPASRVAAPVAPMPAQASVPWGMIIGGLLLIGVVVFAMRAMARRNAAATLIPGPGSTRYGGGAPAFGGAGPAGPQPYAPVGPQPYGGMPAAGGGLGSGLLGGLATGAALGAGMVAGQALAHRFTEGQHPDGASILPIPGDQQYGVANDMGGNDFGVADAGSWDDNSFGGVDNGGGDWT